MQRYEPPVFIDKIQYATELLPYIKMYVDQSKRKGEFWLTGSQVFHLMKNVSESLTGRVGIIDLLGLSNAEIYGEESLPFQTDNEFLMKRLKTRQPHGLNEIYRRIFKGSMPELYAEKDMDWETYYRSYVETYLQRDFRDLAQAVGISAPTAKKWLSLLVSSYVVVLVQPYHNNALKRVVKMPQVHFLDTGLAAYLLKWGNPEALGKGAMSGAFFESYVFSGIYKSYLNAGIQPPAFYYRDKDKKEIDLLLLQNNTLFPIEIKKSASPGTSAIKNFLFLIRFLPLKG